MSADSALHVNADLTISRSELTFRATRAGGPGGQHVNTSSTRIELLWSLDRSSLPGELRTQLRDKLGARIDSQGNVRVVASSFRSQARNRVDAEERLVAILRRALIVPKKRRATRPGRGAVEARLRSKKLASQKKQRRRDAGDE